MKGFFYFLGGICVFTEISMFMRATSGLEKFSLIYLTTMIIIGCLGYFFFSKANSLSKATEINVTSTEKFGLDSNELVTNNKNAINNTTIEHVENLVSVFGKEDAIRIIESRKLFKAPEKFTAKVTNITPFIREDGTEAMIVSIAGMTPVQVKEARRLFDEAEKLAVTNPEAAEQLYQQAAEGLGEAVPDGLKSGKATANYRLFN